MSDFLICFHVQANAGYAIEPLEIAFFDAVSEITGKGGHIHLGYSNYDLGEPRWLNDRTASLVKLSYNGMSRAEFQDISTYVSENSIKHILAFDLPVEAMIIRAFRKGGAKNIISYYGAPMSSLNHGLKLILKRFQVLFNPYKPDHFIFESNGMRRTATHGRGINEKHTSVVRLGIDVDKFASQNDKLIVYNKFNIPLQRRIIFYAGHMEKRKGVDIIIKAAATLVNERHREDLHFLICGNRHGEDDIFSKFYKDTPAEGYITFGGYRDDLNELMAGCYSAVIASTGWDSFPRSSLEMAVAGLPLIVSDLAGLNETIENNRTGLLFTPGNHIDLADKIEFLVDNTETRDEYSANGKDRVKNYFTLAIQKSNLVNTIQHIINK